MGFQWDDIRLFLAIMRCGSLPEAAKELKIAHSTVFRRLNAFEQQVGVRLFVRSSQGFSLTQAGESILQLALEMEDRSEQIARNITGQDYVLKGVIRVTTTHGMSLSLMQPVFNAFTKQHSEVCLDIQWGEQIRKLNKYESDVIILPTKKPPENAFGRKVCKIAFGLFANEDYIKTHGIPSDLTNLSDHHVIALSDGFSNQSFYHPYMQSIQTANITMICDSFLTIREAVISGAGIGLMPWLYAQYHPVIQPVGGPLVTADQDLWILTHQDLKNTVRIRAFMGFAFKEIQAMKHALEGVAKR